MTRVVLTQPNPRVERLAQRLRERGHEVHVLPLRRLVSLARRAPVAAALASLAERDWVVFVSPGAIEVAFQALPGAWPVAVGIAVIGPGSAQALAEYGIVDGDTRVVCPHSAPYDADALMRIAPFDQPGGLRILVLNGIRGRVDWIEALAGRGAQVERVPIYRSESVPLAPGGLAPLRAWARERLDAVFVFTNADVAREIDEALVRGRMKTWARAQSALAPHPRIVERLRELGWRAARLIEPGEQALLGAIESA